MVDEPVEVSKYTTCSKPVSFTHFIQTEIFWKNQLRILKYQQHSYITILRYKKYVIT